MDHKLVLEDSSLTAVYTLPNTTIYLKAVKNLNIRLSEYLVNRPGIYDEGAEYWGSNFVLWL